MTVDEIAKAIAGDDKFWDRVIKAMEEEDEEKAGDKDKARAEMAMKILKAESVEEAIKKLKAALAKAKEEEEEEAEKAKPEKDEEEAESYEEEEYPKPAASKALPEPYAEQFAQMRAQIEAQEELLKTTVSQLQAAQRENRRKELALQAEKYAALPEVEPEKFTDVLVELEATNPELFKAVTAVLDVSANAMRELYMEEGTQRTDGTQNPFEAKVEARAAEIQKAKPELKYEQAYSEAFSEIGAKYPRLARAYLDAERRQGR